MASGAKVVKRSKEGNGTKYLFCYRVDAHGLTLGVLNFVRAPNKNEVTLQEVYGFACSGLILCRWR